MRKHDRIEAACAVVLIVMAFAVVFGRYLEISAPYQPRESLSRPAYEVYWATVEQDAPLFEGAGMYTPMVGKARVGEGVEVLSVRDGYACVWHYQHLEKPVYISAEYISGVGR
jgi:hypothetical protein